MVSGISVVIPNYNGIALFPQTLPGIFTALENAGLPYEVIVADDVSTDESIPYLQENFPLVQIIRNAENKGFSITANKGIRAAKFDLVLLLNSDVKLEPGYFIPQLSYFSAPDTFGVMGRIIGWEDNVIQDGAKYPSFHNAKIKTSVNYLLENEEEMKAGLFTSYISGANALFDRKKFLHLGGFNEMFSPFYVEDYELSVRAWRYGWKCYYANDAICRHKTSTTIRSRSSKAFIKMISNRNKWFLHALHLNNRKRIVWMMQLIPEIFIQLILLKGYYAKAFVLFLKSHGELVKRREAFEHLAPDKKLLSLDDVALFIKTAVQNKKVKFF